MALAEIAAWCQGVMVLQLGRAADLSDFRAYDVAARIGLSQGWSRIYNTSEQLRELHAAWPAALPLDYISLPTIAWLVAPLTALPPHAAFAVFAALVWTAMLVASRLAAPPGRWWRLGFALLVLGTLPAAATVVYGQVSGLVLLALVAGWRLLDAEKEGWAGVVLAGIALKPHLAVLVPVALLVTGRWRALAGFGAAAAVLGMAAFVLVGEPGLEQMVRLDAAYTNDPSTRLWSLGSLVGGRTPGLAVQVVVVAVALAAAWMGRRGPAGPVIAVAVAGSLLANVYLHGMDLVVYLMPVWAALRQPSTALRALALLLWLSLDVALIYPWATALASAALLAGLLAAALPERSRGRAWL